MSNGIDPLFPRRMCGMCPHFSYFEKPIDGYDGWCTLLCRSGKKNEVLQRCPLTRHGQEWVINIAKEILHEARAKQTQSWLVNWAGGPVLKLLIVPIDILSVLVWLAERGEDDIIRH